MIGSKIPRYLFLLSALGGAVGIIMLALFYAQYQWLANEILTTSTAEHDSFIEAGFERGAGAQLRLLADRLVIDSDTADRSGPHETLARSLTACRQSPFLATGHYGHVPSGHS
jgi:hypothetical protein